MTTTHTIPRLLAACATLCLAALPLSAATFGNFTYEYYGTYTPSQTIGIGVFNSVAPDFKINYIKGKTGFTTPTWYGYPCAAVDPSPEIDIQQPLRSILVDGSTTKRFGTVVVGQSGTTTKYTIKNTGTSDLTGLAVSVDGHVIITL